MGRLKQRHNWKARQNNSDSNFAKAADVPVEISDGKKAKYDESNIFVLPSKKQPIKKAKQKLETKKKILSRKQRKKLEKITEKKKKNLNRADLLKSLAQVQVEKEELQMMVSTSEMQTKGLKRHLMEPQKLIKNTTAEAKVNSITGRNKKRKEVVTSLQQDSSSDDDEDDDDDDMNDNNSDDDDDDRSETESHSLDINKELPKEQPAKADLTPNSSLVHSNKCEKIASQEKQQMSGEKTKPARIPAIHVPVFRTQEIEEARSMLPIITEEQSIMEAINENPVVIICGETGSGKTTQVPQFLFEAGYTSNGKQIGITEPRRVAAISMSQRVAAEMNLSSNEVSYQIRFEGNTTPQTKIKFMTDGVLLKEVEKDFLLTKYSAVIIDEAHERSMFSDILIGLLSRIVPLREKKGVPLKLIIMSATLRVEDFINNKKLFKKNPCVIQVKSRQYPVSIHFNKVTPMEDYLGEAFRKVCKIHQKLPDGGILVFVTGQQEVHQLSHRLRRCFPFNKHKNHSLKKDKEVQNIGGSEEIRYSKPTKPSVKLKKRKKEGLVLPEINLDDYAVTKPLEAEEDHESELEELNSDDDIESETYQGSYTSQPMYVLPLFSLLSSKDQAKVFSPPPPGSRLCVIATNVAETSLTIPHIKYVVDTGKVKTRVYDKITGISTFIITWTSKASANQRAGRAGRTGAGHCYRLFSSAVFSNDFENYSKPEIQRKPVDDLVLQMKHMNIDQVVNFPFPSPPDEETLKAAEKRLQLLGALEPLPKNLRLKACIEKEWCSRVTSLGHAMATFPIAPCYAKMLALGNQHDLLLYVICLVSALSVQEVLLENLHSKQTEEKNIQRRKWMQIRQTWVGQGNSLLLGDIMVLLKAIGAAQFANCSIGFCESHGLNQKAVLEVNKLQVQLTNIVNNVLPNANLSVNIKLQPPSDLQAKLLRQIILAGLPNHVARKISESEITDAEERVKLKGAYKSLEVDKPIFFNPTSVLRRELPEFVVYQELFETKKIFMRGVTAIEVEWLPIYAPGLCSFSKPLEQPPPYYDKESGQIMCYMSSTFGPHCWPIEAVSLPYPHGLDKFKHIAYFFLDGQIFPKLGKFKKVLLSSPSTMLKTWARLQSRTETLLHALVEQEIDSRDKFLSEWQKDKLYLLPSYKEWIPEAVHTEVDTMWPPV